MCTNATCQIHRSKVNFDCIFRNKKHRLHFCCHHRFYSSLREKCAVTVSKKLISWITEQRPGPFSLNGNQPTSNVFIADFIELNHFQFCRTVIALNEKIYKELCERSSDKNCNKDKFVLHPNEKQEDLQQSDNNCIESNIAGISRDS